MSRYMEKVLYFVMLTYITTILFFILLQLIGGKSNPVTSSLLGLSMAFPFISVFVVQKCIFKQNLKGLLGTSFKFNIWYLSSILIPIIMAVSINIINIILFKTNVFSPKEFISNIIIGLSIASISALLEELAWRGFLFNEFIPLGMFKTSLFISIIWALWHTPVTIWYKYPGTPLTGAIINFAQMFIISIIITHIRSKSESIFPCAIMHGMFNTMILSSTMDSFKIVLIKFLIGILIITILLIHDFSNKRLQLK